MTNFDYTQTNFNSREEYLSWRASWKQAYKSLSTEIRANKIAFKNEQRSIKPNAQGYFHPQDAALYYKLTAKLESDRKLATSMLTNLSSAKELAKQARQRYKESQHA